MSFPKRLERKTIYESRWINLYVDKVLMPSGKIIEAYHQLEYPYDGVVTLLHNTKNEICFIRSLRYTTQQVEWELPAGGRHAEEEIIETAAREVLEETGFVATNLRHVYSYKPSNGMAAHTLHVVFGDVEDQSPAVFDTDEVESVVWLDVPTIKTMILRNEITDGVALVPLLLFFQRSEDLNIG